MDFIQRPIVVLVSDLDIARQGRIAPPVDEDQRTTDPFEVVLVPVKNRGKCGGVFLRGIVDTFGRIDEGDGQALELRIEFVRLERLPIERWATGLAQLSAKWTRGSPNFGRMMSFSR